MEFYSFSFMEMAPGEKGVKLKPVDGVTLHEDQVIRLGSEKKTHLEKSLRLVPELVPSTTDHRLDLPAKEDYESRTYEPGIEALIESGAVDPNFLEQDWEESARQQRGVPWGWFVLIGLTLAGAAIWSLTDVNKADVRAEQIREETESVIVHDEQENREAAGLIDRIDATTRDFFQATRVEDLVRHVRQPERVQPLMERYYARHRATARTPVRTKLLQPLTLDNHANFWMKSVEFPSFETSNLIIEVMKNGEPKIDWETYVCHQPMPWDDFATQRPDGSSFDFRVYVEPDNFFSHEFSDATQWNSFRLTALEADETLFGYAKIGSPVSEKIIEQLKLNLGKRTAMILRLTLPEGLKSRRGVLIEDLMSPRWLYTDLSDSSS